MAEKVVAIGNRYVRDYKTTLYFIDGNGNLVSKPKDGGDSTVLFPKAVVRDSAYLYFIDKDGDVARSPRASRKIRI